MAGPESNLRRLSAYLRPDRREVRRAAVYSVANKLFDIAPELLIGVAVDVVVRREESFVAALGVSGPSAQIFLLAGLTALIWAGESWFQYLYQLAWRDLAQRIQSRVRLEVYDHVQRLPMADLSERRTGELQTLLSEDVHQLERFLDGGVNDIIQVVTSTVAVVLVFFVLAPEVAVLAVLPIPVIAGVALAFQRGLARRYRGVREAGGRLGARLTAQLRGIPTLRAFLAEELASAALERDSVAYLDANRSAIRLSSAFVPLVRMAVLSGFLVTLVLGGLRTLDGRLAVGSFSVLVFLTQRLLWPFTRLGETVDLYQRSMASAGRLFDLLAVAIETEARKTEAPRFEGAGDLAEPGEGRLQDEPSGGAPLIAFEQVSFRYPGAERDAVTGLDLAVSSGSFLGIVGATGAGKSTIVQLLLRFFDPSEGRILLRGRDLRALPRAEVRRSIGWVGQDAFVFHGTIGENIALGRPNAGQGAIERAARDAELLSLIESLPAGYDTPVGEFGSKLSGGERQRLAIARALLVEPEILIFDEATSAVDNETEAAIHRSILRAARGRTVLAIAHRLSTLRDANQIVVLDRGRIAERGTHDELLAAAGIYAGMSTAGLGPT